MSAPKGIARLAPESLVLTERPCLGFGEPHTFLSSHSGHRRCAKCEAKFQQLHLSAYCEETVHVESGTQIPND